MSNLLNITVFNKRPEGQGKGISKKTKAVSKRSFLFNIEEGENFNLRHTSSISRIKIFA